MPSIKTRTLHIRIESPLGQRIRTIAKLALTAANGNVERAAEHIGIHPSTLRRWIRDFL